MSFSRALRKLWVDLEASSLCVFCPAFIIMFSFCFSNMHLFKNTMSLPRQYFFIVESQTESAVGSTQKKFPLYFEVQPSCRYYAIIESIINNTKSLLIPIESAFFFLIWTPSRFFIVIFSLCRLTILLMKLGPTHFSDNLKEREDEV
jgi:hypothetical protein